MSANNIRLAHFGCKMNITELEEIIASYLGRTAVTDLNPSNLTPPGVNLDLGMVGLNTARRRAEQARDFKYSETSVFLSISNGGGSLTNAYINGTLTVAGGPFMGQDPSGIYTISGVVNGLPFYTMEVGGVGTFFLNYYGTSWYIAFGAIANAAFIADGSMSWWEFPTTNINPTGSYPPEGAGGFTGTATVTTSSSLIGVKRVRYVSLPISGGGYEPIEFLTKDQYISRVRMQTGRQPFNAVKTLPMLGAIGLVNPLAYQDGQTIFLASPYPVSSPVIAQLSVTQWLPDYTTGTDSDFITTYGSDYMYWRGILEVNNLFRRFVGRQEGNINEQEISALADDALQRLIAWDADTIKGTSDAANIPIPSAPVTANG